MMMPLVAGLRLITFQTADNADYFGTHYPTLATSVGTTTISGRESFLMASLYLFEPFE